MKKVLAVALMMAMGLFLVQPAFSMDSVPDSAGASVTVEDSFSVSIDQSNLSLGNVGAITESSTQGLDFHVKSNHGVEWTVKMYADPLLHADGITTIPSDKLRFAWAGDFPGFESGAPGAFGGVPSNFNDGWIYTADPSQFSGDSGLGLLFKVDPVGYGQKSGSYSTTIHIKAVDSI